MAARRMNPTFLPTNSGVPRSPGGYGMSGMSEFVELAVGRRETLAGLREEPQEDDEEEDEENDEQEDEDDGDSDGYSE
jgi:hypothetical protein